MENRAPNEPAKPSTHAVNPWEIADWQRDLVDRLPPDMREPVRNAFYYFDIAGTSSQSFFTHLIVLLGAARYWSENFPLAIQRESDAAVRKFADTTAQFTELLQRCVQELQILQGSSMDLQRDINANQKKAVDTLNTIWTRIATQLSNRKFIQVLGEDLAKVLIASQDRVKPQIEASYKELEGTVQQTTDLLQRALNNNAETIRQTMIAGVTTMHRQWEESALEIQNDLAASKEVKVELAKTYREMRQYVIEIEQFNQRAWKAAVPLLLTAGLGLGVVLGVFVAGGFKGGGKKAADSAEVLRGSGVSWQVSGGSEGQGLITLHGNNLKVEPGPSADGSVVISYQTPSSPLAPARE
jgi:hypothetical protein